MQNIHEPDDDEVDDDNPPRNPVNTDRHMKNIHEPDDDEVDDDNTL